MPTISATPIAPPRGVDLWSVPLDQPDARAARLIAGCSAREHERASRMPVERRRRDFLVGRGIVRRILGAYLGIPPRRIEIAIGAHGKPFVDSPRAPAFNLSHSQGLAVLAVTSGFEVGVDVERVDRRLDVAAIARQFLSPEEASRLSSLGAAARAAAFYRLWTRKEAYAKASGAGFTLGMREASASLAGSASPIWDGTRTIVDINPARGYVGAIAYDAPPVPVQTPDHALACL